VFRWGTSPVGSHRPIPPLKENPRYRSSLNPKANLSFLRVRGLERGHEKAPFPTPFSTGLYPPFSIVRLRRKFGFSMATGPSRVRANILMWVFLPPYIRVYVSVSDQFVSLPGHPLWATIQYIPAKLLSLSCPSPRRFLLARNVGE